MKRTVAFYWLIGIAIAALAIALGFYFDDTVRDFMAEHQTPALRSFRACLVTGPHMLPSDCSFWRSPGCATAKSGRAFSSPCW